MPPKILKKSESVRKQSEKPKVTKVIPKDSNAQYAGKRKLESDIKAKEIIRRTEDKRVYKTMLIIVLMAAFLTLFKVIIQLIFF